MQASNKRPVGRRGFTLVELMIVIAIIGLLVAMLAAAVVYALQKGPEVSVRNDINQLGIALENFKAKYGSYPPSLFLLCENGNDYANATLTGTIGTADPMFSATNINLPMVQQLIRDSRSYLQQMFPRINSGNSPWMS